MSVADLQELEEIKGLVTRGQQLGVLTYAEIAGAVSELDLDEADVEELHGFLERAEIELVEELDPALAAAADLERAPDKRSRRKPRTALDLKPDMTTDSLQLFLKDIGKVTGIEPDEVESIKRSARAPVALEKPVGDEEESEFGQFIADERAESPYERAAEILTKEALREALENLSYRERRVLELRYGLGGEHPRTLDEVGRTFNVTRERLRPTADQSLHELQSLAAS